MKLIIQRNHYSCGAVALYNAMVLLNIKPPPLKKLTKMCKTTSTRHPTKPSGTYFSDLAKTSRKLGLTWKKSDKRKFRKSVYLLNYQTGPGLLHIVASSNGKIFNYWNGHKYVKQSAVPRVFRGGTFYEVKI